MFCVGEFKVTATRMLWLLIVVALSGCTVNGSVDKDADVDAREAAEQSISRVLDALHLNAAEADFDGYFALFHDDAIFLGTDRTEHWLLAEFKRYARPRFESGGGWAYTPGERRIHVLKHTAWFEERVHHARYGEFRGTGVLVRSGSKWLIMQYNLSLPIPNEMFDEIGSAVVQHHKDRRNSG